MSAEAGTVKRGLSGLLDVELAEIADVAWLSVFGARRSSCSQEAAAARDSVYTVMSSVYRLRRGVTCDKGR